MIVLTGSRDGSLYRVNGERLTARKVSIQPQRAHLDQGLFDDQTAKTMPNEDNGSRMIVSLTISLKPIHHVRSYRLSH